MFKHVEDAIPATVNAVCETIDSLGLVRRLKFNGLNNPRKLSRRLGINTKAIRAMNKIDFYSSIHPRREVVLDLRGGLRKRARLEGLQPEVHIVASEKTQPLEQLGQCEVQYTEIKQMQDDHTPPADDRDPLLSTAEVAALTELSKKTLDCYRSEGKGPNFEYLRGGKVAYRRSNVEAWMAERAPNPVGMVDTKAAAEIAGCKAKHLQNLRSYGQGPAYVKMKGTRGKIAVFYRPEDVIAWRDAR